MACGDVLSLEDLQTAKKHQIFEAEVITGKVGGVAGGATIDTATNPVTGQTQQTLPSLLADLGFDVQSWTSSTGGVLASANQVFLNDTPGSLGLGDYYAWGGPFEKTVPAGTDPALPTSGYIMRSSRFAGTQAREALRRSYAEAGYNLVNGSFEAGGTLVNANDVLLQERTGKAFSGPIGSVAPGTDPALNPAFTDVSDFLLVDITQISFSSVSALKASVFIKPGDIVGTKSYYSGAGYGGATYKIMTLADARTALSDAAFTPDGISSHYTDSGYVALITNAIRGKISVLQCGAGVSRTPSENSAAFASAIKAMQAGTKITAGEVLFPPGNFQTTDPIANIPAAGAVQRLVKLRAAGRGKTVITKTTTNTVNVRGVPVDAVLVEAPDTAADYAYFGDTSGFSLMRSSAVQNVGYSYYAVKCAVRKASDLECNRSQNGYYTDDCWMSSLDSIWALMSSHTGISILGGTSNTGTNLYSDGSAVRGFNFRGLTYSELHCSADSTGASGTANALAYDFDLAKGVSGQFNCEKTRGSEFRFVNSDGINILGGRSFNSNPVLAATTKIIATSSTVKFAGFDWTNSISNLSSADKLNYSMISRDSLSSVDFDQCVFSADMDSKFPRQLDGKFAGSVSSKPYCNDSGVITHSVGLVQNTFKKLCYVGNSGRFKIDIGICSDPAVDAVYTPVDETGLFVGNVSTNSASPTNVMKWNTNGAPSVATLLGYISDGWLMVTPSNAGNNRTYKFRIFTQAAF